VRKSRHRCRYRRQRHQRGKPMVTHSRHTKLGMIADANDRNNKNNTKHSTSEYPPQSRGHSPERLIVLLLTVRNVQLCTACFDPIGWACGCSHHRVPLRPPSPAPRLPPVELSRCFSRCVVPHSDARSRDELGLPVPVGPHFARPCGQLENRPLRRCWCRMSGQTSPYAR